MKRNSGAFPFPMTRGQAVIGWIYLILHIFVMMFVVNLMDLALQSGGVHLSDEYLNAVYYGIGFVILLITMFRYLKASFSDLLDNLWMSIKTVFAAFLLYYLLLAAVSWLMGLLTDSLTNPNQAALDEVLNSGKLNRNVMTAVAVLLAPVVEEVLFRGVAFGTLRRTSRVLAYAVSILLFAVYHLWNYFLLDFQWSLLLYLIQYIPAGFVLAWCYERSRSIWPCVVLHMLVNFVSLSITFG